MRGADRRRYAANAASIRATMLVVAAGCMLPAEGHAQSLFWPWQTLWWGDRAPLRHKPRHRHVKPQPAPADQAQHSPTGQAQHSPNGPLEIIISIADQRITVYDDGALIARSSVSTGVPRHPTPTGVFSVISKQLWHRSNIYSAAPMPYMQRITWSGIALHAGVVPGHPASHGCIRLKRDFAVRLWHLTRRGTRVIIAPDDIRPVEIASPKLVVSESRAASGPPDARAGVADAASVAPAVHSSPAANAEMTRIADFRPPGTPAAAVAPRKPAPVSVFVSRKLRRLFVRQGFAPLFDVPVGIRDPEQSLGTHVFTRMASRSEGAPARWSVVSMPQQPARAPEASRRGKPDKQTVETVPMAPSPERANAALERIELPQDAAERLSELMTPGSSLIVSDYGISAETGEDTDFIVVAE